MAKITALFFDIGGVILTNTWGHESRRRAAVQFQLDGNEFERLHEPALSLWETGQIGFDDYLDRAVFNRPRAFSREVFKDFMLEQSQAFPETLAILAALAESKKYLISALNNESREMNQHRIERFELRNYFTVFFSSCYLGVRKPDEAIYRAALLMSQRAPEERSEERRVGKECRL